MCTKGVKVHSEVGTNLQSLLEGVQRNKWTIRRTIGVPLAQKLDVPNFFKYVPNFVKDAPNFVNDVPRDPKSVPKWGLTSNHLLRVFKGINGPSEGKYVSC